MSIERIYYCDGPDCETHQQTGGEEALVSWITTRQVGNESYFCSWDCVLRYAAQFDPIEKVRW